MTNLEVMSNENMKYLLSISLIIFGSPCFSQHFADKKYYLVDHLVLEKLTPEDKELIESNLKTYHSTKEDTTRINAINTIVEESYDDKVWPKYNRWVYEFATKKLKSQYSKAITIHLKSSLAAALSNFGYNYQIKGDMHLALVYYTKSLKIQVEISDKKGMANSYNNIGFIHSSQGNVPQALDYYHKSLKIYEDVRDKEGMTDSYNNIGVIYQTQGDIPQALDYYCKSLRINKKLGDKRRMANSYRNLGTIYNYQNDFPKAIAYLHESIKLGEEIRDKIGLADSYNNIGTIHDKQKDSQKAFYYFNKGLKIREDVGDKKGMALSYNQLGCLKLKDKEFAAAEAYLTKGLNFAREVGSPKWISENSKNLSSLFKRTNRFQKALEMHELHIQMKDSLNNEATQKAAAQQQAKYNYEKQKVLDDASHDKLIAVEQEQKQKQKIISYATTGGLLLILGFLIFVFNRLKVTKRQRNEIDAQKSAIEETHHQLAEQHKEIKDSINYAERIQRSFLATKELLDENLGEYFVFFKPKDVVSGDFYWADKMDNGDFVVVNADSTGHGVPGAIMSILNISSIEGAIKDGARKPNEIFNRARTLIIERLKRDGSEQGGKDGMDASIICFNENKSKLTYAAAQNPIWIIRSGQVIEIKAEKMPVGKHDNDHIPFEGGEIDLQKGDLIYTLTDGFQDQFGGEKGKKMMVKRLREYILSIAHLSITEQHQKIDEIFTHWKGNLEQVDDVCIIGVKI